jgi:hypothetical protein
MRPVQCRVARPTANVPSSSINCLPTDVTRGFISFVAIFCVFVVYSCFCRIFYDKESKVRPILETGLDDESCELFFY